MAFLNSKFEQMDVGVGTQSLRQFGYRDRDTDTLALIGADGYFDPMKDVVRVNDFIFVKATDGVIILEVSAVETTAPYIKTQPWGFLRHAIQVTGFEVTAGGAATEIFTIPGIKSGDFAFLQMVDDGPNNVTILSATIPSDDTLTVLFSADPGVATVFNYLITKTVLV